MSHSTEEAGHGHSIAAWTTVIVIIVAFSIGTFFFFLENAPAVYASAALALAGVVAGLVLRKMGYGVGGQHTKSH
jgi:membrane protein YdbS with pleckstrin-like domain